MPLQDTKFHVVLVYEILAQNEEDAYKKLIRFQSNAEYHTIQEWYKSRPEWRTCEVNLHDVVTTKTK